MYRYSANRAHYVPFLWRVQQFPHCFLLLTVFTNRRLCHFIQNECSSIRVPSKMQEPPHDDEAMEENTFAFPKFREDVATKVLKNTHRKCHRAKYCQGANAGEIRSSMLLRTMFAAKILRLCLSARKRRGRNNKQHHEYHGGRGYRLSREREKDRDDRKTER